MVGKLKSSKGGRRRKDYREQRGQESSEPLHPVDQYMADLLETETGKGAAYRQAPKLYFHDVEVMREHFRHLYDWLSNILPDDQPLADLFSGLGFAAGPFSDSREVHLIDCFDFGSSLFLRAITDLGRESLITRKTTFDDGRFLGGLPGGVTHFSLFNMGLTLAQAFRGEFKLRPIQPASMHDDRVSLNSVLWALPSGSRVYLADAPCNGAVERAYKGSETYLKKALPSGWEVSQWEIHEGMVVGVVENS